MTWPRNGESRPERRRLSKDRNSETSQPENRDALPHRQAGCAKALIPSAVRPLRAAGRSSSMAMRRRR